MICGKNTICVSAVTGCAGPTSASPSSCCTWTRSPRISGCTIEMRASSFPGILYVFVVQPVLAGHGPYLFAGLRERRELKLVERREFRSGAVALRYEPGRVGGSPPGT